MCFVATESREGEFFRQRFERHAPEFAPSLAEVSEDVEVLSVFIGETVDADFLAKHPRLAFVTTRSTACDHIDVAACRERGIPVAHVAGYGQNTVAEHTFALMFSLARRIPESTAAAVSGAVTHESFRGFDLRGRTLGVIGAGRVGLQVIRMASAFGMRVLAHDAKPQPLYTALVDFSYTTLEGLLAESDVITLHVPLSEATFHMLDRAALAQCRRGVLIINTARGGLIDSAALLEALETGQVGGAGLDVLEEESVFRGATAQLGAQIADRVRAFGAERDRIAVPAQRMREISRFVASSSLLRRPDVIVTPHNAYNSEEARAFINRFTAENIETFLRGGTPSRLCVPR